MIGVSVIRAITNYFITRVIFIREPGVFTGKIEWAKSNVFLISFVIIPTSNLFLNVKYGRCPHVGTLAYVRVYFPFIKHKFARTGHDH